MLLPLDDLFFDDSQETKNVPCVGMHTYEAESPLLRPHCLCPSAHWLASVYGF